MNSPNRKGRLALTALIATGVTIALAILVSAYSMHRIEGYGFVLPFVVALGFNALSLVARWLLTKSHNVAFVEGRLPGIVGLAKLVNFVAFTSLVLSMVIGLLAGPPLREITLRALLIGMFVFAIFTLFANGILNGIIVARHFRGTLRATSREKLR